MKLEPQRAICPICVDNGTEVLRYLLSPHVPEFARELAIPRTLGELAAAAPSLASGPSTAAITFDDGPHPQGTRQMLEILSGHAQRAIFFLVGERVERYPDLAKRIVEEGHGIGLHGQIHRPHPVRSAVALRDDFERGLATIVAATGVLPQLHRPPFGVYSPQSLQIARELGLQPLMWSRWGKDWRKLTTPERIARRVLDSLEAGDVILLHDCDSYSAKRSHLRTAAALPEILSVLKSAELDTVAFT
jgi:peptidoglycan/xylan/chitin deacetylase (PgdA/CDA1 family)